MSDMKNTAGKHSSKNVVQMLMDAAQGMTINADDVEKIVESIITSCHTQGTKGETHKSLLLRRADSMKIMAELYKSVAKRYENAVKLADAAPEDKVLPELLSYNIFISDQIKSEIGGYEQILSILRN